MVATFFLQRTTAFILVLIVPSLHISCFRKTKKKQYANGENNGFLAGVSLPPSLLAHPSRFSRAQNPLSLPFQTPATQAKL